MHRESSFLSSLVRLLFTLALLAGLAYLGYQAYLYWQVRELLPLNMTIAGIDVGGLTLTQAGEKINNAYNAPIYLVHRTEQVELEPAQTSFQLDLQGMLQAAEAYQQSQTFWQGYLSYLLKRPIMPANIELRATHNPETLQNVLQIVADLLDDPPQDPSMLSTGVGFVEGKPGYVTDIPASLPAVQAALYDPQNRTSLLVITELPPLEPSMQMLKKAIETQLATFEGIGSIFVMDLQTGEEIGINADLALTGTSILKIAIFMEAYRALDNLPTEEQLQLFDDTATRSSNYAANLLLHIVAGEDNTYKGVDLLTESMQRLGLINTFMVVPFDADPPSYRPQTLLTPANSRTDINTLPDPGRQTTAEDIGTLLGMIYSCAKGGGALLVVYPQDLTPAECQAIIDLMVKNEEGNLIRFGVPEGTVVSHKHGWALSTHADAGIIFSPNGDYVFVEYLFLPGGDWLVADYSFPILRELSRIVYNYFNRDNPYLGRPSEPIEEQPPTVGEG